MTDSDPQTWRDIMEVNLFGAFHLAQFVVPSMQQRGDGRLIFVNSGASTDPPPTLGAYAASKAALASLVRTLAVELGPSGIRANGIQLGPMTGENFRGYVEDLARRAGRSYDEELARWNEQFPLRATPTPRNVREQRSSSRRISRDRSRGRASRSTTAAGSSAEPRAVGSGTTSRPASRALTRMARPWHGRLATATAADSMVRFAKAGSGCA